MIKFILFVNKNGNKKLAIELDNNRTLDSITERLNKKIDDITIKNGYTFVYSREDNIKNIPIIPVDVLISF